MRFYPRSIILLIVVLPYSCLYHNDEAEANKITQANSYLSNQIADLEQRLVNDSITYHKTLDSLNREIEQLQLLSSSDAIQFNDSLTNLIANLSDSISLLEQTNRTSIQALNRLKRRYADVYRLRGSEAMQVKTEQSVYDCYIVDVSEVDLSLYWKDSKGQPLRNFSALENYLNEQKKQLVFAMNAGMYKKDNSPQGLYIQDKQMLIPIDRRKEEYGNFYMQPNGIFMIDTSHNAHIIITDDFDSTRMNTALFATQSGPMALIKGKINDKFNIGSNSTYVRNGVGIIDEKTIVFIISNSRVTLYDFASVFRDKFNCSNALYLDGAISRMYLPEIQRHQKGGNFGPMIGIHK